MSAAPTMKLQQNVATPYGPIPAWYEGHSEDVLEREVHHRGKSLGFKVKDVLPARRWAIDRHGDTLSDSEFEPLYKDWCWLQLSMEAQGNPITQDRGAFAVPRVDRFLDKEPDHDGTLKRIGQDEQPEKFRVRQRYAHTGETIEEHRRKEAEESARRESERARDAQARQLMQFHREGVLDADTFAKQMESLYGVSQAGEAIVKSAEAESAPDPTPEPVPKEAKAPTKPMKQARCGYKVKGGVHLHEKRCAECKRLKESDEEAATA